MRAAIVALVALCATGLAEAKKPPPAVQIPPGFDYIGPDKVQVDLLRASPGGNRIFVQVMLPDGKPGLFMVDTGASISAISEDTAKRLGLEIERDWGSIAGLGGTSTVHGATVPVLKIGDAEIHDVAFAVGAPGVPEYAGWMPLDGIIGDNVLARFTVEIDYPGDRMILHRPGTAKMPKNTAPMYFDGGGAYATLGIRTDTDPDPKKTVPLDTRVTIQLDTGASDLILAGPQAFPYDGPKGTEPWTEGIEPVLGIGAADTVPANSFFRSTRRIPVESVYLGGKLVKTPELQAQWMNFDKGPSFGPQGFVGLAGHELFADHVSFFDFLGGGFALANHHGPKRQRDGNAVLLAQDIASYGKDDVTRYLFRARLETALDHLPDADSLLTAFIASNPPANAKDTGEARVLLATIRRAKGDLDGAWKALEPMTPDELVAQGEIIASVNGLLLEDRAPEALALADAAVKAYSKESAGDDYDASLASSSYTARADVLLQMGKPEEASDELRVAAHLLENPDAQLIRRARIALAEGDRYGAIADVRRLVQLYPSTGMYLWFYATLVQGTDDEGTFRADMADAIGRLHPYEQPLDYMTHAYHLLGDQAEAETLMNQGIARDCDPMPDAPTRGNCTAWYYAMAEVEPDKSLKLIDKAMSATGDRSDFLDTAAMVHLSRDEFEDAHTSAVAAARMSPDEIYMLWQAERIGQIAAEHRK